MQLSLMCAESAIAEEPRRSRRLLSNLTDIIGRSIIHKSSWLTLALSAPTVEDPHNLYMFAKSDFYQANEKIAQFHFNFGDTPGLNMLSSTRTTESMAMPGCSRCVKFQNISRVG